MNSQLTSGLVLLGAAVPILLGLGWYAWNNRALPGAYPFLVMLGLALIWAVAQAVELVETGLSQKLFWANLQYVGICFFPVAAIALALDYGGHRRFLRWPAVLGACLVPLATLSLLFTDKYHHLMRAQVWLASGGDFPVLNRTWGPWFWVHTAYSTALMVAALGILAAVAGSVPALSRRQPLALIAGPAIAGLCTILYLVAPAEVSSYDITFVGLLVAAVAVTWGLFRPRLFSLVPIARHALVENLTEGVLVLDQDDHVVDLNSAAQRLIDRPVCEILSRRLGETWDAWTHLDLAPCDAAGQMELRLDCDRVGRYHEVSWSPLATRGRVVGRLVVVRDITERVAMEESLRQQALTDGLTGLPNRALFMSRLDDAIRRAQRHGDAGFAVMVLDLDRFKLINDSIGHLAGDVLLQSVAGKLRHCVRDSDTVGRMGGDEFMVLLQDINSPDEALPILERIQQELSAPVYFRQQEMMAASSVGMVLWNPSYRHPEDLLRAADTAMYQAKEDGRGCFRLFDEEMHRTVSHALKAETDLRAAIRDRDFSILYQPIVELHTGAVRSLEALLRWRHRERGLILPDQFIGIAENGGLIVPLGKMALDDVCSQISRWRASGSRAAGLRVSLNLSPRQLAEPDFLLTVTQTLQKWDVPAVGLALELTETALFRDPMRAKEVMQELRSLGMRVCLDDFGRGWSSLQHLTTFPVEELKIDQSFIGRIARGVTDLEVVRSLIALAHTLGLRVTAEGVEHSDQWNLLEELGCDYAQGYFSGRPMEPDELLEYLEKAGRPVNSLNDLIER